MKAKETRLLDFLRSSKQFVIPIYQRPYRWDESQCRKLWADLMRASETPNGATHFVGSVVYIQDGLYQVVDQPALLLIDGQQRMTTFLLLIEALARAQGDKELEDDFAARRLRQYYLKDSFQDGDKAYKMLLSATDSLTLKAIIDGKPMPDDHSLRIKANFDFFVESQLTDLLLAFDEEDSRFAADQHSAAGQPGLAARLGDILGKLFNPTGSCDGIEEGLLPFLGRVEDGEDFPVDPNNDRVWALF